MATATTTEVTAMPKPRRRRRWLKYGAVLVIVLLAWAAYDLYAPRSEVRRGA